MRLIQKWASHGALRRLACSAARYGKDEMFRARRSVLYMPGANERALEKAKTLDADSLILDLEDSVAPDAKAEARAKVAAAVTAGGFGRAGMTVVVLAEGGGASIRVTGSATHPDEFNGHSSAYTRNPDTFSPEGLLLTIEGESDFAITNNSFASPFPSQFTSTGFFGITPARLTAVSGTITSTDGLSGRLSAGTYRLDLFISAFGSPDYLPEWAGYQSILDLNRGVQSASMNWTLSMTPVPAPGPLAVAAVSVRILRRRRR